MTELSKSELFNPAEKTPEETKAESFQKIKRVLAASKLDASLSYRHHMHLWELSPQKIHKELDNKELEVIYHKIKSRYEENLKNLAEGKEDGYSRYLRLLDNFLYVEIYSIGNNAELLKALFEFGKKERSLEGSRFYHNTGEIAEVFLHYKYFPDDPATRNFARDFISGLLKREEKAIKKGEFKKYALDYVAHFVKMGILDEENDADLIDAVTAAD